MTDSRPRLRVALVWHFHQPNYADPVTGVPAMPWTRLHALKDYADMAARLERHPRLRVTVNWVPSLLDQLADLASGTAGADPFLSVARKAPEELTQEERAFIVGHFFSFSLEPMARGLPRLQELSALRGEDPPAAAASRFDDASIRDLQVLFHVAWSGPLLRREPLLRRLVSKGRGFTEEDKKELFDLFGRFLEELLPRWGRLADAGRVELSASAYYHPILPLLCDLDSALEALPGMRMPSAEYRHPEDAAVQLERALLAFERAFGRRPAGGWPPEGAVSERALQQMAKAGYRWAASDEEVLFASLGVAFPRERSAAERERARLLYAPWRFGDGPALLFRDHDLSDRIGFVYSGWPAEAAASDFLRRLQHAREMLPAADGPGVVSVILDGENAWEFYPDHAEPFFEALYAGLEADPGIETVTASEAVETAPARPLARVRAGSWIGGNLATWIGHPEKNRAWELLAATREAVASRRGPPRLEEPAWRAVFVAEGSDWFWWFGDDHPSPFAGDFDALFRAWLREAWRRAGIEPPPALEEPVRRGGPPRFLHPAGPVRPVLDGRVTDYFEWLAAGEATPAGVAMQAASPLLRAVRYGTDGRSLFLRLDPVRPPAAANLAGSVLTIRLPDRPERTLRLAVPREGERCEGPVRIVVDQVIEVEVPLEALGPDGETTRFQVELEVPGGATQRLPVEGTLAVAFGSEDPSRYDWFV